MNNFTNTIKNFKSFSVINEASKFINTIVLSKDDIIMYLDAVKKNIPEQVADIIYITAKFNLCSQKDIDDIKNANKSQLSKIAFKYNMSNDEIIDLWESLKTLKTNIRLLPQYQTISERKAFMNGKLDMTDITIDIESSAGRNACAKQYMPMVHKIANSYVGKSKLSKPELISAALQGFTDAMNEWRKNGDESSVPFKTYAAYRVKQQILNDINTYSYSMKTNWYGISKMGSTMLTAISLDGMPRNEEGEFKQDRLKSLGKNDPAMNLTPAEQDNWNTLFKLIEGTFKQRDVDIFYRYFGLKGYGKEKGKDIAKSLGIASSMVTHVVKTILDKLKDNSKAMEILKDIQTSYNESLMIDIMNLDKSMMIESILADDMFILLEELTKWSDPEVFIATFDNVCASMNDSDIKIIKNILSKDFEHLDKVFKTYKKTIIKFLGLMNPTESFNRRTDVTLLDYMNELGDIYKKYCK
jgi:RNA polymerase sigma factor (sigma-70 family)